MKQEPWIKTWSTINPYWHADAVCGSSFRTRLRVAKELGWICDAVFRARCAAVGLDWREAMTAPLAILGKRQKVKRAALSRTAVSEIRTNGGAR